MADFTARWRTAAVRLLATMSHEAAGENVALGPNDELAQLVVDTLFARPERTTPAQYRPCSVSFVYDIPTDTSGWAITPTITQGYEWRQTYPLIETTPLATLLWLARAGLYVTSCTAILTVDGPGTLVVAQ